MGPEWMARIGRQVTAATIEGYVPMNEFEKGRMKGHEDALTVLKDVAGEILVTARNMKALGQEGPGKLKEEAAKNLLSLVASLPTRLRSER